MKSNHTQIGHARLGLVLACGLSAGLFSGCESGGSGRVSNESKPTVSTSPSAPTTAAVPRVGLNDAEFLDGMSRFAELSTQLAELELSNGKRPEVQELAEKIKRRESVDIAFLSAERARLGMGSRGQDLTNDPRSIDLRRRMQAATPEEADTIFVQHMIKHRLETAKYAESCLSYLNSPNLSYYCRSVSEDSGASLRELRSVQTAEHPIPVNARAGLRGYQGSTRR